MLRPALALASGLLVLSPAGAQDRRDQDFVYEGVRAGEFLPFPRIVQEARRQVPGGTVIGTDFDPNSGVYRIKLMSRGAVTWVDVDGRSGQILNVEGR